MTDQLEKYPKTAITVVLLLMLLVHLDIPDVTIMEARNFITAREMVNDGHWLLTTMNGEARYQKPPLPTWLTALSGLVFGMKNAFALRLPAVLMILLTGIFTYLFSLKFQFSKLRSLHNGLILVTSFYIIGIINEAPWDIYTHGFMLAGIYFMFHFLQSPKNDWKYIISAGLFMGLSIMSKGPVSLYALFLPFLLAYGFIFKFKGFKKKVVSFTILIIIALIIGGWWFLYVRYADPEAFMAIATKETDNWSSYQVKPFYYYWSFFIQSGIWCIPAFISLLYPYMIKRVKHKKAYQFFFLWTILSVVLLSIIPEKKPRYLVPALIPLASTTGFYIHYLIHHFKSLKSRIELLSVYFNFGLIALIGIAFPIAGFMLLAKPLENVLFPYLLTSVLLLTTGILIIRFLIKKNILKVFYLTVGFMVMLLFAGLPLSKAIKSNPDYNNINALNVIEAKEKITTYSVGEVTPELLWEYDGIIKNIYDHDKLSIPAEATFGLLIMNRDIDTVLPQLTESYTVVHKETFNINYMSKQKERLIRQFYLVKK